SVLSELPQTWSAYLSRWSPLIRSLETDLELGRAHDTKRGEDTPARISVLSELPQTWSAYLSRWSPLIRSLETDLELGRAHDTKRGEDT
ncbi:hypothetical protein, partial [Deinococcus sp. 43]|uniref:hypothetical protein n=1 Tax=Deinococcus sp. 43 TaxID=532020 RepID=UPI0024DE92BC